MALLRLDPLPTFSKNLDKNRWADFLELLCLESRDKEISLNDIITLYTQEELSGISNGDENHSQKVDGIRADFTEIFRYIFSRMEYIDEFYPFVKVDEDTIKMAKMDDKRLLYIFLLFSSNTNYITDLKIPPYLRLSFERISIDIMKMIYPNFSNELFGTSTKKGDFFYGDSLIDKLDKVGVCLNTLLKDNAKSNPRFKSSSGDAGIDIISYNRIDREICSASMLPVCIGQCSTSYTEWYDKQLSIKSSSLNSLFENLAAYHEYIFVSFPLRGINGKWAFEEAYKIQTIVIDRIRFLNILHLNNKPTLLSVEISDYMKTILGNFDVAF